MTMTTSNSTREKPASEARSVGFSWGVFIVRFLPHPTVSAGDGPIIGMRAVSYKHR